MFSEYVEVLARHAKVIFKQMTGTEVLGHKIKIDERQPADTLPLAHVIDYERIDNKIKGQFVLGFGNRVMAVSVAAALAEKMGLDPPEDMDAIAIDLLNEFLNIVVGRTISEWDRLGLPVRFSPPKSVTSAGLYYEPGQTATAYIITLGLTFSHIALRVTFAEDSGERVEEKRVMVVEDSAVIRNIIAKTLEQYGFTVKQAEHGQRAQEIYPTFNPQLVLMDLVMPHMGGLEAMEGIRKMDPAARFIVLTSSARKDEVLAARSIGVAAYLIKPFNPELLMREVNKFFVKSPVK